MVLFVDWVHYITLDEYIFLMWPKYITARREQPQTSHTVMSGYDCHSDRCNVMTAEINVFSFCRNTVSDVADVMSSGRLFHSFGPTEANDCSPTVTRHDGQGMTGT